MTASAAKAARDMSKGKLCRGSLTTPSPLVPTVRAWREAARGGVPHRKLGRREAASDWLGCPDRSDVRNSVVTPHNGSVTGVSLGRYSNVCWHAVSGWLMIPGAAQHSAALRSCHTRLQKPKRCVCAVPGRVRLDLYAHVKATPHATASDTLAQVLTRVLAKQHKPCLGKGAASRSARGCIWSCYACTVNTSQIVDVPGSRESVFVAVRIPCSTLPTTVAPHYCAACEPFHPCYTGVGNRRSGAEVASLEMSL